MTFEDTTSHASTAGAETIGAPSRQRFQLPPAWSNKPAEEMLEFVDKAALISDDLRGLGKLLKGVFDPDCTRLTVEEESALRIIGECIGVIAARLDSNAEHARARRNHLASGGAR